MELPLLFFQMDWGMVLAAALAGLVGGMPTLLAQQVATRVNIANIKRWMGKLEERHEALELLVHRHGEQIGELRGQIKAKAHAHGAD